jgi:hypothetical protein
MFKNLRNPNKAGVWTPWDGKIESTEKFIEQAVTA